MLYDAIINGPTYSIGGLVINGATDTNGCDWILTSETGWNGRPAPKQQRADRASSSGTFYGAEYPGARVITLTGVVSAPNVQTLRQAERFVHGFLPSATALSRITVADETGLSLYADVKTDASPTTTPLSATSSVFSFQFMAPDPRKLDTTTKVAPTGLATQGTGGVVYVPGVKYLPGGVVYGVPGITGAVSLFNAGTAPADMVLTFTGPLVNPTLSNLLTGDTMTYNGTLVAGDTLVVDTASGSVLFNGYTRRASWAVTKWQSIDANAPLNLSLTTTNIGDTGMVSIAYHDSYY